MEEQEKEITRGSKKQRDFILPASIILAAVLISASFIYSKRGGSDNKNLAGSLEGALPSQAKIREISKNDHILGNPKSEVIVIGFSDLECPYCKTFHDTMKQTMSGYAGKIAWVFRHFPLDIHPKSIKEAEATECAAEIGGSASFWQYVDKVFEVTPSNNGLDPNMLPKIAEEIGLDKVKFENCLKSGKYIDRIKADTEDALNAGARGTPYSVVITKSGKHIVIPGAFPYENSDPQGPSVKAIIEEALKN